MAMMNLMKDREEILKKIAASPLEYVVIEGHEQCEHEENRITVLVSDAKKFCQQVFDEQESYLLRQYVESNRFVDVYIIPISKGYFPGQFETRLMTSRVKHKLGFSMTVAREAGWVVLYRNVVHFRKYGPGERYAYLEMLKKFVGDLNVPPKRKAEFSTQVMVPA